MTPQRKVELKRETAARLKQPYADSLHWLARCRQGLHSLDPKDPANREARRWLFISGKSWIEEARASRFAFDAASPDRMNDRRIA